MRIRGALERMDAEIIQGWLTIEPSDGRPQILEIVVDGQTIGQIEAKMFRQDVKDAGFGDGACGFWFRMPPDLEPDKAASAQVRLFETDIYLTKNDNFAHAAAAPQTPPGTGSIFILGPPRSGTSITFLALKSALGLSGVGEGHVLPIFQRMLYTYYQHVKGFIGHSGVLASSLQVPALQEKMIAFVRRFYFDMFGGEPFIDKTPGLEALVGAPFLREVFPGAKIIVMSRNGVEVIQSYRRKFGASFEDACREWIECSKQVETLKETMPDILFLDQYELRVMPEAAAKKLGEHVGRLDRMAELGEFLRDNREDVLSDPRAWDEPATPEAAGWTDQERNYFASLAGPGRSASAKG